MKDIFMKPTPEISTNQRSERVDSRLPHDRGSFPLTAYSYQSIDETFGFANAIGKTTQELRTFRKASNEFFDAEASREYLMEAIFFVLISAVAAWPTTMMIRQLAALVM